MITIQTRRQVFLFLIASSVAFLYAYSRVKYFLPVELVVEGRAVFPGDLHIEWNSGRGFNVLEQKEVRLSPALLREFAITRTGKQNMASQGSDVWIQSVESDPAGQIKLEELAVKHRCQVDEFSGGKAVRLTADSSVLRFDTTSQKLKVNFLTNISSGFVSLSGFSDKEDQVDLFSPSPGSKEAVASVVDTPAQCFIRGCRFSMRVPLSPDQIVGLKIRSSVHVEDVSLAFASSRGIVSIPLSAHSGDSFDVYTSKSGNEMPNAVLIGTQVFFAVVTGLLCVVAMRHLPQMSCLFSKPLLTFWCLWGAFLLSQCFWWVAYWPVSFSPDSLFTWRTARRLDFYDDSHPFLNVFYVLCLRQLWDDPAVISLFQILSTSALGACIYSYCLARGVSRKAVYFCAVLFILSVPVSLYSITLWRDTPFALLMLGWAFFLALLKDNPRLETRIRIPELILMSLSLTFLMLRHNGKLTLILIPILLLILGLLPRRKGVGVAFCTALLFYFSQVILKLRILKIYFLYPEGIVRTWQEDLTSTAIWSKVGRAIFGFFNTLDINMNWRETNVWRGSWGNVASYESFQYNADIEAGFIQYKSLVPALRSLAETILSSSYSIPLVFLEWNPVLLLYFFVPPLIVFWRFPRSCLFAFVIVSQTIALIFFTASINWRYFYFQCLACYFILPIILLDKPNFLDSLFFCRSGKFFTCLGLLLGAEVFFAQNPKQVILRRELEARSRIRRFAERSYYLPFSTPTSTELVDPEEPSKRYVFDSNGMRCDKKMPEEDDPRLYRVMLLGDEVLLGEGLDFHASIAGHLSSLHESFSRRIKFLNAALTGGGSPDSYYAYLREQGFALNPDMIILLVSPHNDLSDLATNSWIRHDSAGGPTVVSSNILQRDLKGVLLNMVSLPWTYRISLWSESRAFMALMAPLSTALFGTDLSKGFTQKPLTHDESFNRLVVTLKALRKTTRARKIKLAVVVLPDSQLDELPSATSKRVLELLKKINIPRVDLTTKINTIKRSADGTSLLSAQDSADIADEILSYLKECDVKRVL